MNIYNQTTILSISKYNNEYKRFYMYKEPILYVKCNQIDRYKKLNYKVIVNDIVDGLDLKDVINSGLYVIGLQFTDSFNNNVDNLPETIKYINFGKFFNRPINNLPKNIISLKFSKQSQFGHPLDKLPPKLKILEFENYAAYGHSLQNLPKSLKILSTPPRITGVKCLPENLKKITFHGFFDGNVDNLPKKLKYLELGWHFSNNLDHLPKTLKILKISGGWYKNELNKLPNSLIYLSFDRFTEFDKKLDNLPKSLKYLKLGEKQNYKSYLNDLPPMLKTIFVYNHHCAKEIIKLSNNREILIKNINENIDDYIYV